MKTIVVKIQIDFILLQLQTCSFETLASADPFAFLLSPSFFCTMSLDIADAILLKKIITAR